MIRLQRSQIPGIDDESPTLEQVQGWLQSAIELEHATIPLYLYALYSLDDEKNAEIANIIQSVVVEEMLHMTLSSNVLNALGGSPQIDTPCFIPKFPGPLPGGVESRYKFNLARFSMKQLDAFLDIEQPEHPLPIKAALAEDDTITIGQFYAKISEAIDKLGDGVFVSPPRNQVGPELVYESVVVVDVKTARQAIATIVEQGEGTKTSPGEVVGQRYAHYYRFMQVKKGHLLVPAPELDPPYAYKGAPVPFDRKGVYAVPTNPSLKPYPPGTAQALANDNFNYTYTSLLLSLHGLFNGEANGDQFNRAIGLMMSLKGQAKAMMSGIPNPKVITGPSFEYQPTNPKTT